MEKNVFYNNMKSRRGFSLLELLLVLGVIAVLVVAAFIVYPKVQVSQRIQTEIRNILTIQNGIRELYISQANSSDNMVRTEAVIAAKIFPEDMLNNHFKFPTNLFGGRVSVGKSFAFFEIQYEQVPEHDCVKIITGIYNNFERIDINNTTVKYPTNDRVLDVETITKECDSGKRNKINFMFII
ncbi:prepilin-type N-terminal cleavage/methylation domain-containing protein [Salmonella enterica]|nr:prepilin-type N-terminal cleavage/methylation domain-containing protein [Salmonella enterica]